MALHSAGWVIRWTMEHWVPGSVLRAWNNLTHLVLPAILWHAVTPLYPLRSCPKSPWAPKSAETQVLNANWHGVFAHNLHRLAGILSILFRRLVMPNAKSVVPIACCLGDDDKKKPAFSMKTQFISPAWFWSVVSGVYPWRTADRTIQSLILCIGYQWRHETIRDREFVLKHAVKLVGDVASKPGSLASDPLYSGSSCFQNHWCFQATEICSGK